MSTAFSVGSWVRTYDVRALQLGLPVVNESNYSWYWMYWIVLLIVSRQLEFYYQLYEGCMDPWDGSQAMTGLLSRV